MYCSKCKSNSFDHLPKCPKCGFDWKEARDALQLGWLRSSGYDWFQHVQPPMVHNENRAVPSVDESAVHPRSLPGNRDFAQGQAVLADEVTFPALPDELDHAAPSDHQPLPRLLFDAFEFQPQMPGPTSKPTAKTAQQPNQPCVFDELLPPSDGLQDNLLAHWEIPDDMLPQDLGTGGSTKSVAAQASTESKTTVADNEPVLAADIDYNFLEFEVETLESSDSKAAHPLEDDQNPDQSSSSGQGVR